jgi:hypothetical protein
VLSFRGPCSDRTTASPTRTSRPWSRVERKRQCLTNIGNLSEILTKCRRVHTIE